MTNQNRTYITFNEIAALKLHCKTCGLELSIPLREDTRRATHKCPNCGDYWLVLNETTNGSAVPVLEKLVASIKVLSEWPGQCGLSLEIKPA